MTLTTLSLFIAGSIAALIPIVLHLVMRGRPKRETFPALAFIARRAKQARKKLTLKHLLLLLLRCSILVLLGLALSRPIRVPKIEGTAQRDSGAVSAVIVLDNSIRLSAISENLTGADRARSVALRILSDLPPGSRAAVLDSSGENDAFQIDLLAAREAVERGTQLPNPGAIRRRVADSFAAALQLMSEVQQGGRELYLLTDRTVPGWGEDSRDKITRGLARARNEENPIRFFIADLAKEITRESAITDILITPKTDADGVSSAQVDLTLTHFGEVSDGTVEFQIDSLSSHSESESASEQTLSVPVSFSKVESESEPSSQPLTLYSPPLPDGLILGAVRLLPDDPFTEDNTRWFALKNHHPSQILLAAPEPVDKNTLYLREAIASSLENDSNLVLQTLSITQLLEQDLAPYQAVLLIDPPPLSDTTWEKCASYTASGGGLGIFFGPSWELKQEKQPQLNRLIGGEITGLVRRPGEGLLLQPPSGNTPLLEPLHSLIQSGMVPWEELPVYRHWKYESSDSQTTAELLLSDRSGAIYSRPFGKGTVLFSTTPFSQSVSGSDRWNRLTTGENAWVFLMLTDGVIRLLTSGGGEKLICETGESAILRPDCTPLPETLTLLTPSGEKISIPTDPNDTAVRIHQTRSAGLYTLLDSDDTLLGGFCVNHPASEYDLRTVPLEKLQEWIAPNQFEPIDTGIEVRADRLARQSHRELFPLLVLLLSLLLVVERSISNRFYD